MRLIDEGKISGKQGKDVLVEMFATGKTAAAIVEEQGLVQVSDTGEIDRVIDEVIAANPNQLEQYRAGKESSVRILRGPGDEGLERQGESESGERTAEREAEVRSLA